MFVHDVRLITVDGAQVPVALDQDGSMQYQGVALLDFEDGTGLCARGTPQRHAALTGAVDPALVSGRRFDGIAFRIGVPFELNHIDVTGAPPRSTPPLSLGLERGAHLLQRRDEHRRWRRESAPLPGADRQHRV